MGTLLRSAQAVVNFVWGLGGGTRSQSYHPKDPALADWYGHSGMTAAGVYVTPETAMECPPVYACVRLLANTVSTIPLDMYERTGADSRERASGHPLHDLMHNRPNTWQTAAEFRLTLEQHALTHGNGYGRVSWLRNGSVASIEPMYPRTVMPFRNPAGGIAYRWQPDDAPAQTLLQHEVLHLRRPPFKRNMFEGESPVVQHRELIGTAMATLQYLSRFFSNGAVAKIGVKVPAGLKDEAVNVLREDFERRHRGLENAHRMAFFDRGMEPVNLGMSNKDAEIAANYRMLVGQLASLWGVPLHMIGETEKSTSWGTGIEQQSIGFITYTARPEFVIWEQALNNTLLTVEGRQHFYFEHNVDGLIRGDFKTRMEGYVLMVQWGLATPNEVRRLMNLPPVKEGDVRMHPLNMAPADKILDILLKDTSKAVRQMLEQSHKADGESDGH